MNTDLPEDAQRQRLREHLESMIIRTEKATSWQDAADSLRGLVNREGYVPIRTRLASADLDFLEGAREELLGFASLGIKLLDLHQPRDAGGITSDAARPILRCRSCMWRWPCPTFRTMVESLGASRTPTSCQRVEPDHEPGREADHKASGGDGVTLAPPGPGAAAPSTGPAGEPPAPAPREIPLPRTRDPRLLLYDP
ncbi:hypothetical protein GCM10017673_08840 [Streptosporangium violaceochromogenes]|nr:hypothetical protein GCM10017673_08840 [Streptosporangium violaceochromogenes]